jgi:nucleoside-diphosphate-sugar epimerase
VRIAVTGATGFLGRTLLPLLGAHDVLALVHGSNRAAIPGGIQTVTADLGREGAWQTDIQRFKPEACIHLAWEGLPDYSLNRCRVNLSASLLLIDALAAAGTRRIVVAGSCWEYGQAFGAVREDAAPVGCGVFAATKHAIRLVLESVARERGFSYAWARLFFVYGPGQRSTSLIPHLHGAYAAGATPALRDPDAVQDFVYVDDVARALARLAEADAPGIFNVGSGVPTAARDVANQVAAAFGASPPFTSDAAGRGFWADTRRIQSAIGWRAEVSLADGIATSLDALAPRLRSGQAGVPS